MDGPPDEICFENIIRRKRLVKSEMLDHHQFPGNFRRFTFALHSAHSVCILCQQAIAIVGRYPHYGGTGRVSARARPYEGFTFWFATHAHTRKIAEIEGHVAVRIWTHAQPFSKTQLPPTRAQWQASAGCAG